MQRVHAATLVTATVAGAAICVWLLRRRRRKRDPRFRGDFKLKRVAEVDSGLIDRASGCLLGLMVGDALGASVEGWPPEEIIRYMMETTGQPLVKEYIPAIHMGTVVTKGLEIGYRWATEIGDQNFVGTGPPLFEASAERLWKFTRSGMVTDDSCQALSIAESIVECTGISGVHIARKCAENLTATPVRGFPPTAKKVMNAILNGEDYTATGSPPFFPFEGGSFANGGMMRISPLAIAFRNAPTDLLRDACTEACRSTHVHEEAIDGAVVQASAVAFCLERTASDFEPLHMLAHLVGVARTAPMKRRLSNLANELKAELGDRGRDFAARGDLAQEIVDDVRVLRKILSKEKRPGSGMGFQIAAIDAAPCVLYAICKYVREDPMGCIHRAIALGGDTDTIGSMAGAIAGALHGAAFLSEELLSGLENGERGRDAACAIARQLAQLDLVGC